MMKLNPEPEWIFNLTVWILAKFKQIRENYLRVSSIVVYR